MTAITPNSTGNMIYEPCSACYLGIKSTPNTFLDYLKNTNKDYYHLIQIAKMEAFYNTPVIPYTLFIAKEVPNISNITPDYARNLLLKSTIRGIITVNMLASGLMLYSLNNIDKLQVDVFTAEREAFDGDFFGTTSLYTNGCSREAGTAFGGNKQADIVQKCMINNFYSNDCTPGVVECNLYPSQQGAFGTIPKPSCGTAPPIVQIENRLLTHGDILVEKGVVHILDNPLWPV